MKTNEFIADVFGCSVEESNFIDNLLTSFKSTSSIGADDIMEWSLRFGATYISNFLIEKIFTRIIDYFSDNGLEVDKFTIYVNSTSSNIYYDGKLVYNEGYLFDLLNN